MNHRHRMAQFAGRASTDLHSHVFFKDRVAEEEAYVMRVSMNGLVVCAHTLYVCVHIHICMRVSLCVCVSVCVCVYIQVRKNGLVVIIPRLGLECPVLFDAAKAKNKSQKYCI